MANPQTANTQTANTQTANTQTANPIVQAVATLLTAIATFARYHTRGAVAMCSYRVAGVPGIVFIHCAQFGPAGPPQTLQFTTLPVGAVVPQGSTLLSYRGAVAGGKLGRSSYSALGCKGTFTVCNTLFGGAAPANMLVNAVLVAAPVAASKVTSAVVAAGNVAQAGKAGTMVATPATVATVAAKVAAAIVASTPAATPTAASTHAKATPTAATPTAATPTATSTHAKATGSTAPGKTAAQRAANGKHVA